MENSIIWLTKLIFAHLVSDFALQKRSWIDDRNERKIKSPLLYLHVLITGVTALLFIGFQYIQTVAIITISHFLIDLFKSYLKPNFRNFVYDQLAHMAVIVLCWCWQFQLFPTEKEILEFYYQGNAWYFAAGIFFLVYPSSIIISLATKHWADQISTPRSSTADKGLVNAGKYIGIIERLIIGVLVFIGQYEAIGLLIAAKSILRYNTAKEEVKTEYLLVGTLISMSIAVAVGLLLKYLVNQ